MNLAIIGAKAAGKGTQITKLRESFNLLYFSPSQMFREALKKRSQLGLLAESYISRGELVPDEHVNAMLEAWLWRTSPQQGVIFDGFPRTLRQAEFLEQSFKELGRTLNALIFLDASEKTIARRLSGRRVCYICKDEFHVGSAPFSTCPYEKCAGEYLKSMPEDAPEVVFAVVSRFRRDIQASIDFYKEQGKLILINGDGEPDAVHLAILEAVTPLR